jgi:hypothetical protein
MRIRIITADGYGDRFGNVYKCGDVTDMPDNIAVKLLTRRIAVPAPEPEVETSEVAPPSNAARKTGRSKPRAKKSTT